MKIENAVALITGAGGGLGRVIVDSLRQEGAVVIGADRNTHALSALPESCETMVLDATDPDDARRTAKSIVEKYGKLDILVNAAGNIVSEPLANIFSPDSMMLDYRRFREGLAANLDTVFVMTAAAVEQMISRRTKGVIVSLSSICARGNAGQTAYSAAKAAVNAMTVTWAKELGRLGIRCNAVAPGFIDTPSTHQALRDEQLRHIVENTPLHRLGKPEEVAQAIISLIENDFLTGVVFDVNGGIAL